jgi:pyruvate/2-oxoglutarate/acetoin dehydrogenase E1 component
VVLLGEDIGRAGGVFRRITDGLRARHGDDRVVDTPVAESGIVGAAFGMAVAGMRPVAELQFMGSRTRPTTRSSTMCPDPQPLGAPVHRPMVIRIPYGGGIGAAEHHSESAEAIYAHTPGLKVVIPSTPYDAKGLLLAAVADPTRCVL